VTAHSLLLALGARGGPSLTGDFGADRRYFLGARLETGPVGVDQAVGVEFEEDGVRPQESLDIRGPRKNLEVIFFESLKILPADLSGVLDVFDAETPTDARLAQSVAYVKRGAQKKMPL
jgi:hypothetical protein